jgi:hypothetical protein
MFAESFPASPNLLDPLFLTLPYQDRVEYTRLTQYFQFSDDRNKRNMGLKTFAKHIMLIYKFVAKGNSLDVIRGLLCGIEFGKESLLINTSRMKCLMSRSKSCVNGCFQKLGYNISKPTHDIQTLFTQISPNLDPSSFNSRHWCVRRITPTNNNEVFPSNFETDFADSSCSSSQISSTESEVMNQESAPIPPIWSVEALLNKKLLPSLSIGCGLIVA